MNHFSVPLPVLVPIFVPVRPEPVGLSLCLGVHFCFGPSGTHSRGKLVRGACRLQACAARGNDRGAGYPGEMRTTESIVQTDEILP